MSHTAGASNRDLFPKVACLKNVVMPSDDRQEKEQKEGATGTRTGTSQICQQERGGLHRSLETPSAISTCSLKQCPPFFE
jgi:hypothetical protein